MMNSSVYNAERKTATVASGAQWGKVYKDLHESADVYVTGGRNGLVGVGGFLLGGGNSYYTGLNGFGCDTVTNFEVVLANGTVVNANAQDNSDLWKALKGGGPNFGLVTHVELETMPARDLAYGNRIVAGNQSDAVTSAVVAFTDRSVGQPQDHMFAFYMHNTAVSEDIAILLVTADVEGDLNTTAFNNFTKIPAMTESWALVPLEEAASPGDLIVDGMK
jgi:FAD/FMN-containing dehydrogenase